MGNAAKTFESRQIFLMSSTARPIALPSCVINGAIEIPEKSFSDRKVLIGDEIVPHQFGEPTNAKP